MLRRVMHSDEEFDVVLMCDPSVWAAQVQEARKRVSEELPQNDTDETFISMFIAALRATVGPGNELTVALTEVKAAAEALFSGFMSEEEKEAAKLNLQKEMKETDLRDALAWVRAQNCAAQYRATSDPDHLLDKNPEGATVVRLRSVRADELRRIERAVGPKPRLGCIHYMKAADKGRRVARTGKDSTEAFAEYLQNLPADTLAAVEDYEDWQDQVDRLICAKAVVSVSGFEWDGEGDFPIVKFISEIPDGGRSVIGEISSHCRQVGTLGKAAPSLSPSPLGTEEQSGEAGDRTRDGLANNASGAAVKAQ